MKRLQALEGSHGAACLYVVLFHVWALTGYDNSPSRLWGAYRVHAPIIRAAGPLIKNAHWSRAARAGLFYLIFPALRIGVGYLFFLCTEKPFLQKQ